MHIFSGFCELKHDEHGDHLMIHTPKGNRKVYYKGAGKKDSKKAFVGMSLGSVVYCEIDLLHMDAIQESFRRTFASKSRYHLADLNPPAPHHPIIKEVFDVQNTRWTHWTIEDNPIITDERKAEIKETLSKSPYLYARDWLGQRVIPEGVIYSNFEMNKHVKSNLTGEPVEMYFSADGGQSDATTCSCNIVTRHRDDQGKQFYRQNIVAHYYHSGKHTGQTKAMSQYALEIDDFIKWCVKRFDMYYSEIFVDPACKSLREELHLLNRQTKGADNNSREARQKGGGIETGIERVRSLIDQDLLYVIECEKYDHYDFFKEIGMYSRDRNGKPIDDWNHAMDITRYSGNYFFKRYVK